jgi:hypothetical protein
LRVGIDCVCEAVSYLPRLKCVATKYTNIYNLLLIGCMLELFLVAAQTRRNVDFWLLKDGMMGPLSYYCPLTVHYIKTTTSFHSLLQLIRPWVSFSDINILYAVFFIFRGVLFS